MEIASQLPFCGKQVTKNVVFREAKATLYFHRALLKLLESGTCMRVWANILDWHVSRLMTAPSR